MAALAPHAVARPATAEGARGTDVVRRSVDAWNEGDREGFVACYAEDCELVTPSSSGNGVDGVAKFWAASMTAFPGRLYWDELGMIGQLGLLPE